MKSTTPLRAIIGATFGAAILVVVTSTSSAHADDAAQILKSMTDYLSSQKMLSASFDSDIEAITPELEKIQFASSGQLKLSRPDKLRVRRTGGYADVELVYDGKTISIYGRNAKSYVQASAPGSVDQMIDAMQERSLVGMPGTDLLLSDAYKVLMANVLVSQHIGQGVIDGVECEHLAFRTSDTDWQIWVESGEKPVPRKYVITSKTVAGGPQYTLRLKDWKTDAAVEVDTFAFNPPAGATKVDLDSAAMAEFDEIPPGTPSGAKQ
jgi:hypothetical protein